MSVSERPAVDPAILYPDSDGQPMADNTLQFEWIMRIKGNLDLLFAEREDVFVAGDLLWYPVEGEPAIRRAPDAMVAFGRPKGYRGSYMQWREADVAPQVVFEILSPGNTPTEMAQKLAFYDTYGVEEYYLYDPEGNDLRGWQRRNGRLQPITRISNWASPRLGVRFRLGRDELRIIRPDGRAFVSFIELQHQAEQAEAARQQAEAARQEAQQARLQAEQARLQAEQARLQAEQARLQAEQRAELLAARLRALGIDPEA